MKDYAVCVSKWILRVGISLWITAIFYRSPGVNGYFRAEFHDMVYGQAWRPFVTRALFPAIVRMVSQVLPSNFGSSVQKAQLGSPVISASQILYVLNWDPTYLREYLTSFILSVACLVLFSMVMERLWAAMFRPMNPHGYVFSILGLLGLPTFFINYSYIYDFPLLLLHSTCLLLIANRRWGWYFVTFTLSCLNKETTVLLVAVFAIYFIRCASTEKRTYWRFIALQTLIWLITRSALAYVFRNNPGSLVEFHFVDHNLRLLTTGWEIADVVTWGMIFSLFFHQFSRKPWLLRVASSMLIPLLGACLLFGFLDELRDYYEVFVPFGLLIAYSVCLLLGGHIEIIAPTNASSVIRIREAEDA